MYFFISYSFLFLFLLLNVVFVVLFINCHFHFQYKTFLTFSLSLFYSYFLILFYNILSLFGPGVTGCYRVAGRERGITNIYSVIIIITVILFFVFLYEI